MKARSARDIGYRTLGAEKSECVQSDAVYPPRRFFMDGRPSITRRIVPRGDAARRRRTSLGRMPSARGRRSGGARASTSRMRGVVSCGQHGLGSLRLADLFWRRARSAIPGRKPHRKKLPYPLIIRREQREDGSICAPRGKP